MIDSQKLYERMKSECDFTPVIKLAMREHPDVPQEKIEGWLDAFLQWFSLIPHTKPGQPIQMLRTVDHIWHAFVLNTKFYREFCLRYVGVFVDHDPLDFEDESLPKQSYAETTLALLNEHFADRINPALLFLKEGATCCMGCSDQFPIRVGFVPAKAAA